MAKSTIEMTDALALIDRLAGPLGLVCDNTKTFGPKVSGPSGHKIHVQKGRFLGRIDTTLPLQPDDPDYVQLSAPNGSIRCHVRPDLSALERCLRMLADPGTETHAPARPPGPYSRPKPPPARRPRAITEPVVLKEPEVDPERRLLEDRVAAIRAQARAARIAKVLENPDKYGTLTEDQAAALVDGRGRVEAEDLVEATRNSALSETALALDEAGIETPS